MKIEDLVNPHIRELDPYPPGKPTDQLERELGISGSIKLASNEAPLGPSRRAMEALHAATEDLNRYPDGSCYYLREAVAKHLSVAPECLVFGCGSSDPLELLAKAFVSEGDEVIFSWPSFAMYPIIARGNGATPVEVAPDANLCTSVDALLEAVTPRTKLLFLANPNNPTGTSLGTAEFDRLVDELPEHVVLVADEAYVEYVRRPDFPDSLAALKRRPGLAVLRTFSKIYGLAGLRVGYAVASPELASYLDRARHPFQVNSLAQAAALAALSDDEHVARVRKLNDEGLDYLEAQLDDLGVTYVKSDANFLLMNVGRDGQDIYQKLLSQGVITRPMSAFGLTEHLRVTVGLPEENQRFIQTLRQALGR